MIELWRQLKDQLKVDIQTNKAGSQVAVKFTLTNRSTPPAQDQPEIVFENLILKVGIPPEWHEEQLGSLSFSESATFEYRCALSDAPRVQYDLHGTVSPQAFFSIRWTLPIPPAPIVSAAEFLEMFEGISFHKWLNTTIKSIQTPDDGWTLGQIQALSAPLEHAVSEIRDVQNRYGRLQSFVQKSDAERVSNYRRIVEGYLKETTEGIGQIRGAIGTRDPKEISRTLARVISKLERQAPDVDKADVDKATEDLLNS